MVNCCCLRKRAEETCNHILLWFSIVCSLWSMAFGIMGYNWVIASTLEEETWAWKGNDESEKVLGAHSSGYFLCCSEGNEHGNF